MKQDLKKLVEQWFDISSRLQKELINYLKEVLAQNNKKLDWYNIEDVRDWRPTITYDGGNHPEYASTVDNDVYGIFMKNDIIYLDTAECSEYDINRISISELYDVAEFIDNNLETLTSNQDEYKGN